MDDKNLSYEPMDVDLSSHSTSVMDISDNISNIDISIVKIEQPDNIFVTESYFDVKPENNNTYSVCDVPNQNKSTDLKRQPIILLGLTFLIISILVFQIAKFNCCESLNIEMSNQNLMMKIYGQSVAIKTIIHALEKKENRKILLFYGGTGVGKTFTTSLLLENLLDYKNIYHYTMPSFLQTFSTELMLGLLFCKSSLIVVDDLNRNDILDIKGPVRDLMLKSEKLSRNITLILVYNCDTVNGGLFEKCDDSFPAMLMQSLMDIDAHKYFIKFEPLKEEHLRKCIEDELLDRKLNAKDINKIVRNFNVTLDGCKGVHQKLQYYKVL